MLDLEPIKARHAAATRLKWELLYEEPGSEDEAFDGMPAVGVGYYVPELDEFTAIVSLPIVTLPDDADDDNSTNDLTFIAEAHADIPALVAEVERLRSVAEAARAITESPFLIVLDHGGYGVSSQEYARLAKAVKDLL